jgi:virginiamycin B lyase
MRSAFAVILAALSLSAAPPPVPQALQAEFSSLHPIATLHLGKAADWVLPIDDTVWVGSREPFAVHRIDPATNRVTARVVLPGTPCAGLAQGFGSLWVPLCAKPNALARVDLKTGKLAAILPVGPAVAEGGIAAGGDSLWMITDAKGVLSRIDPATGRVRQTIAIAPGSFNPIASDGVVWVSGHETGVVTAVDAGSGKVLAVVAIGKGPRFMTAGAGAIWVLLQDTGEIVRVDARDYKVTARIAAGLAGSGGDIKFGAGRVWATVMGVPLTRIDAKTNRIERQWTGPGGDSLDFAFDSVWLTDFKAGTVARYPAAMLKLR